MKNKYQKSLDRLSNFILVDNASIDEDVARRSVYTLQQLIDAYYIMCKLYTEECMKSKENEYYEKAFNKACDLLAVNATNTIHYVDIFGEFDMEEPIKSTKEWKEYILKDVIR